MLISITKRTNNIFPGLWIAAALIAPSSVFAQAPQEQISRPNFVFIFADDHAYQAISAYGSIINETPNLDRLATQGMLFENCFVTNSICGPSRAVILTGKYSHINGFYRNGLKFDGSPR